MGNPPSCYYKLYLKHLRCGPVVLHDVPLVLGLLVSLRALVEVPASVTVVHLLSGIRSGIAAPAAEAAAAAAVGAMAEAAAM